MINKFICLQFSLMIAGIAVAQQKPFTIAGNIKGKTGQYIYFSYKGNSYDSSLIENGRFSFKGTLDGPAQAMVMMDRNARFFDKYAQLYIVPGNMQLTVDYNNFTDGAMLKGSSVQAEADRLNQSKASVMAQLKPYSDAYNKANNEYLEAMKAKKDEATLAALKDAATKAKDAMDPYYEQLGEIDKAFMDKYPSSYVTATILRYRISGMQIKEAERRYKQLPSEIRNSNLGKTIKEDLDGLSMGSPGAKAYMFSSTELRGAPLSLSEYKGKYVLLDFWASWCVPCRKSNPHLLSLYSKYKDKGFEIIGISDDDGKPEAWHKAVEKDQIGVWKHILRGLDMDKRLKGEPNPYDISQYYGIHSLPTKILIDPNGVIIGRYGGGGENDEAMDQKLSEIFGG
ncbi:MAG TPA: TlpA disulfide reductase family protein [Flavisolibacter sp.]|nr:TlpA disulfide reductase family protein [Flavisolibacter sp.]